MKNQAMAYVEPAEPAPPRPVTVESQGEGHQFVNIGGRERAGEAAHRRPVHRFKGYGRPSPEEEMSLGARTGGGTRASSRLTRSSLSAAW